MNHPNTGTRAKIVGFPPVEGSVVDSYQDGDEIYVQIQDLNHSLVWAKMISMNRNITYLTGPLYMRCPVPDRSVIDKRTLEP